MALFVYTFSAALVSAKIDLESMFQHVLPQNFASPPLGPATHESTAEGCQCTSKCGATFEDAYACDWCSVPEGCGKKSLLFGNYDWCVYNEVAEFEAQTHKDKMSQVWKEMTAPDVVGKSGPVKDPIAVVHQMVVESMRTTMETHRDVLAIGRTKVIHAQGAHCQIELNVAAGSEYTGIFSAGVKSGIIRLGSGTSLKQDMFPGFGIKFFRTNVHSANFVALRSTGPGGSHNFFEGDLTNHVAPPPALQALMKFEQASACPSMVGLSDVCTYDQDGSKTSNPVFPYEVLFRSKDFQMKDDKSLTDEGLMKGLSKIPVGTHLFDVYAFNSPTAGEKKLGELKTTGECVQSLFGDLRLAFWHQRIEFDFQLRPEWVKDVHHDGCHATSQGAAKYQCPFAR